MDFDVYARGGGEAGFIPILPVVVSNADPAKIAGGLADLLDDKTIVVASSDLSHYYTYEKAQALDYRNSGDTAGRKDNVVGYSAIAFYEPPSGGAQGGGQSSPPPQGASREPSRGSLGEADRKLF